MKKTYTLSFDHYWSAEVEIDEDIAKPYLMETVQFFMGAEERLARFDGNVVLAYLDLLKTEILYTTVHDGDGMLLVNAGCEGFYPLDGSHGVRLVSCEPFNLKDLEIDVTCT